MKRQQQEPTINPTTAWSRSAMVNGNINDMAIIIVVD
jgi:hypothetical protein